MCCASYTPTSRTTTGNQIEGTTLVCQVLGAVAQLDKSMMESCGSPAIASASATANARGARHAEERPGASTRIRGELSI